MADKFKACSVDGCKGNAHWTKGTAKGLCCAHYWHFRKYGDPLAGGTYTKEPMRFVEDVALRHSSAECLIWPHAKSNGYGGVYIDGKRIGAHRYICERIHGPPPTNSHQAAHSCGGGKFGCVNPNHLEWKTQKENEADKLSHGTSNRGEKCGTSKLTEYQVREILALRGSKPQSYIANEYGVSRGAVSSIFHGRSWSWLD